MATNGLKSSPSVPETLPPKKRNSRDNSNELPSEHVFKTPSPFWNQNGFKRVRRSREPVPVPLLEPHIPQVYHPQWPEVASALNPALSHALSDGGTFPSWGHHFTSSERLQNLPNYPDNSDPMRLHNLYSSPYYYSYIPAEPRDVFLKSYHRRLTGHSQYSTPVVRPVPQSLACHYSRGILSKDSLSGEEARHRFEGERVTQWHERLQNQRAAQEWRPRKRDYTRDSVKWDSIQWIPESGTEPSRHKQYSESKEDLSQNQDGRTGDVSNNDDRRTADLHQQLHQQQQQQLPVTHPSCSSTKHSKWGTEEQAGEQLPLLARNESTEAHKQLASTWQMSRFMEGSLIELVGGKLKRVEDLKMEDFESCTESCPELSLRRFTVQKITHSHKCPGLTSLEVELADEHHLKLSLEVCEEYPFYVCGRGWSSCSPERTAHLCCLHCHQLQLGDVCLALTPVPAPPAAPTLPCKEEVDEGNLHQGNSAEQSAEEMRAGKQRKRHRSAPELRNLLQCETRP
ncbi:hypothetical protein AMEX_G26855 [Astyanax mexicanus]|uniref:AXH domain-containing protein n=1 Tax=Astyanax mexicanus TaxID=7994 RepID=A0A8T2KLJ6_ASTMX|nr:hypothetical protein AMEX_G26855 [Astyanax mexicanus]